ELQIKTVYQHAWAAANHDLGYKSEKDLPKDQRRKIAFTAAQSWGADQIFRELAKDIHKN
ncbi:MAG: GTP pyrophosphokinase, partial [Candidatus Helarchaeota archaeon]